MRDCNMNPDCLSVIVQIDTTNNIHDTILNTNLVNFDTIALSDSYTMGCPPVRGDNPRALASGLSPRTGGQTWYNYFIPLTSV